MISESNSDRIACVEVRIEAGQLVFTPSGEGGEGQTRHGSLANIKEGLARYGVTEPGVEHAINLVEELIMPILRTLPEGAALTASGSELECLFRLLPATGAGTVPLASVECLYNELVGYAAGSPIAWRHTASPEEVALGLVVLREVMQHGRFRDVAFVHPE